MEKKEDKVKKESDNGNNNIKNESKRKKVDAELFMKKGKVKMESIMWRNDTINVSVS